MTGDQRRTSRADRIRGLTGMCQPHVTRLS